MRRRTTWIVLAIVATLAIGVMGRAGATRPPDAAAAEARRAAPAHLIVGPGRVEPASEEIEVGSELPGRLRAVRVDEGSRVAAGDVIAELEADDYRARLASARAALSVARAELERLLNGSRREERDEAHAAARQAEAVLTQADAEARRREALFREGVIPREEVERASRDLRVAQARHSELTERHRLVDAAPRAEDAARARASVALATAQVAEASALLEKTLVRAPLDAVVLRRHRHPGESVVASPQPTPIVTLADVSRLRVRVDVDETDIAGLRAGQAAWVTADAFGTTRFTGRVVRVGEMLGRKNVRIDTPTERLDNKILETLVELDPGMRLPIGLRVDAFITRAEPAVDRAH